MTKTRYSILIIALMTMLTITSAFAELIVVEDHGGKSATKYYEAIGITPDKLAATHPPQRIAAVNESFALPIRSERLSPGIVEPRQINAPGLIPFFLIGDDDLSRRWLTERGDVLRKLGAMGLVVNVRSLEDLQQLRMLAHGLTLSPVPGDDLAGRLQLKHYPALITATGIEQ